MVKYIYPIVSVTLILNSTSDLIAEKTISIQLGSDRLIDKKSNQASAEPPAFLDRYQFIKDDVSNQQELYSYAMEIVMFFNKNLANRIVLMSPDDWLIGITLIVAGLMICRYPILRKPGLILIEAGFGAIGYESLHQVIAFLKEKGLINTEQVENLEELVKRNK